MYVWGNKRGPTGLPRGNERRGHTRYHRSHGHKKQNASGSIATETAKDENNEEESGTPGSSDDDDDDEENATSQTRSASSSEKEEDQNENEEAGGGRDENDDGSGNERSQKSSVRPTQPIAMSRKRAKTTKAILPVPTKLDSLCGEDIVEIAVGRVHCAARTKYGDVYTWGHNDHCQLGHEAVHSLTEAQSRVIKHPMFFVHIWDRTFLQRQQRRWFSPNVMSSHPSQILEWSN